MAYYSQDYMHRYNPADHNKERPAFLYMIQSIRAEGYGQHRVDGDNRGGRAPKLDIIHQVNLTEMQEKVSKKIKQMLDDHNEDILKKYIDRIFSKQESELSIEEKTLLNK